MGLLKKQSQYSSQKIRHLIATFSNCAILIVYSTHHITYDTISYIEWKMLEDMVVICIDEIFSMRSYIVRPE